MLYLCCAQLGRLWFGWHMCKCCIMTLKEVSCSNMCHMSPVGYKEGIIVQGLWGNGYHMCVIVKQYSSEEGTGGTRRRCSWHLLTPWSRREQNANFFGKIIQVVRKRVKAINSNNQLTTKGPIIANEGQPGGKSAAPPGCPDNPKARSGTVVWRVKKDYPHWTYCPMLRGV